MGYLLDHTAHARHIENSDVAIIEIRAVLHQYSIAVEEHRLHIDPTDMANRIREAMYAYGFAMVEESDKGYNQPAYDTATTQYTVQWTWCWREEVAPHAP